MTLNDVYNVDGLLRQQFPDYEIREGQVAMSKLVMQAIEQQKGAVIEAPTGTGKGFAYLIPLLVTGRRAIVSTSNKNLQNQLDKNDLPALQKVFGRQLSWSVLKGKNNYFCWERFQNNDNEIRLELMRARQGFTKGKVFETGEEDLVIQQIAKWAETETIGDLEYFPIDVPWKIKELIACDTHTKHEDGTDGYNNCFAVKARLRAKTVQIVLVNHTLLTLDIAVRKESDNKASVLPDSEIAIIDEAHDLEESAIRAFSDEISIFSLTHLLNWSLVQSVFPKHLRERLLNDLQRVLSDYLPQKGQIYYQEKKVSYFEGLEPVINGIEGVIKAMENQKGRNDAQTAKAEEIIKEAEKLQRRLSELGKPDDEMLRWSEAKDDKRGNPIVKLKTVPLDVSGILSEGLFQAKTVVCTSATLSVSHRFNFFKTQVGMPKDCLELIVSSPFDYKEQALVYISDGSFGQYEKHLEMEHLLKYSDGRAFILFTSYKDMKLCFDSINIPYPKFMQTTESNKSQLLTDWRNSNNGVLFATKSFWEGVDIRGEQLSLVIIHKIPFGNPYNLIYSSKCAKIDEKAGKKISFIVYSIPDACIKLKQGVGRLIRSKSDKGVIALLDSRINHAAYKGAIIDAMPPTYLTQKLEKVERFFEKLKQ